MNEEPAPPSLSPATDGPAPPKVRVLGAPWAIGILLTWLAAQLAVAVAVGVYVGLARGREGGAGRSLEVAPSAMIGAALGGTVLAGLISLWLTRFVLRGAPGGRPLAPIGWAPAPARAVGRAALVGLALVFLLALVSGFLPPPTKGLGPLARLAEAGGWARFAWAFLAVVCAPPIEEFIFRGVLYTGLERSWGRPAAGAIATMAFAGLHAFQIGGYWPGLVLIGFMGAVALRARVVTGSLLPAIALHATYNLGLVLAMVVGTAAK